ncbi:MAG TPA: hypothetical protein VMJ65_27360 [Solirubrobacteraceae bacterium]|nr:hypothetical protein [Solirubrobacteraceae bacterium]
MMVQFMRRAGAVAILAVGAVHLQQYLDGYDVLPTVGTLFLLNAISAAVVGAGLLLPVERPFGERVVGLLALGAVAIAAGSLIALFIAETGTLFGFAEDGFETPIVIAIVVEVATVVLLAPVAVANLVRSMPSRGGALTSSN